MTEAEFERGVERERAAKPTLGGRTVADDARRKQLSLSFGRPGQTIP